METKDVDALFPTLRRAAIELKKRLKEQGYDLGFLSTYRDIEAQEELYAIGRTNDGTIITNKKPGESYHNYGLAFDIFQDKPGYEYDMKFLKLAGRIGRNMGLEWGGDFLEKNYTHFQWRSDLSIEDLKNNVQIQDRPLKWELKSKKFEPELIDIEIDDKICKAYSVVIDNYNYVRLVDFCQANYKICYNISERRPIIKNMSI